MVRFGLGAAALGASIAIAAPAQATVITSLPGGTAVPIPGTNQQNTSATQTIAPGIVADPATTFTFGWTSSYSFAGNGSWSGTPMIGLDLPTGSFAINFASPISAFLAQINWTTLDASNASFAAYNANGGLLESFTFENGSNLVAPGYYGFSRSSNEISSVVFSNEYIGVRNLSVAVAAVPEPSTWAMMLIGFGAVGFSMRRNRRAPARALAMA